MFPLAVAEKPQVEVPEFKVGRVCGIIRASARYNSRTRLGHFAKRHRRDFQHFDRDVSDKNFPNPSRRIRPGEKFIVRLVWEEPGTRSKYEDRMNFLRTNGGLLLGAHGLSLMWEQLGLEFNSPFRLQSLDELDSLWRDKHGVYMIPRISYEDGFQWGLDYYSNDMDDSMPFLLFRKVG